MTREEALKKIEAEIRMYDEESLESVEWEECYEALKQESILDKIKAEIDEARFVDKDTKLCRNANASGLEVAMQIIDKYKVESEE